MSDDIRAQALENIKRKRQFQQACIGWLLLNALMVVIWFFTDRGYFWPIWTMIGMGIAVAIAGWNAYGSKGPRAISDADVDAEVKRMQGGNQ